MCPFCSNPLGLFQVKKDGPNHGRDFYRCDPCLNHPKGQYFAWADEYGRNQPPKPKPHFLNWKNQPAPRMGLKRRNPSEDGEPGTQAQFLPGGSEGGAQATYLPPLQVGPPGFSEHQDIQAPSPKRQARRPDVDQCLTDSLIHLLARVNLLTDQCPRFETIADRLEKVVKFLDDHMSEPPDPSEEVKEKKDPKEKK